MLSSTTERVPSHTAEHVNQQIRQQTRQNVERAALGGRPQIDRRLTELDDEWDIERTLEANAASVVLAGCALGLFVDRRFFALPALVGAFLLQHALQGWCPPLPLFRRMGVRTAGEIEDERRELRAIRGGGAPAAQSASRASLAPLR